MPFPDEAEQLLDELRDEIDACLDEAAEEEIREIDLLEKKLHDDLGQLRLRQAQAPPDGAAGRRRGLERR